MRLIVIRKNGKNSKKEAPIQNSKFIIHNSSPPFPSPKERGNGGEE